MKGEQHPEWNRKRKNPEWGVVLITDGRSEGAAEEEAAAESMGLGPRLSYPSSNLTLLYTRPRSCLDQR